MLLEEHSRSARSATWTPSGVIQCGSGPLATRAGGQDDGSYYKLLQNISIHRHRWILRVIEKSLSCLPARFSIILWEGTFRIQYPMSFVDARVNQRRPSMWCPRVNRVDVCRYPKSTAQKLPINMAQGIHGSQWIYTTNQVQNKMGLGAF